MEPIMAVDEAASTLDLFTLTRCRDFRRFAGSAIAPDIPLPTLLGALGCYLRLEPGEVLLAIVRYADKSPADAGCALTNRRVHWAVPASSRPVPAARTAPARACSVAYADLSPKLPGSGGPTSSISCGEGSPFSLNSPASLELAVLDFLKAVQPFAVGESELPGEDDEALKPARAAWPAVVAAAAEAHRLQGDIASFRPRSRAASYGVVTPLIALACVAVFGLMVARGVSPFEPDLASMLAWGADFGPAVSVGGQWWRLFTCLFLHFGIIHLGMNMWCLLASGPLIERLFGWFVFAAIYLLSGLGGAIASLAVHPLAISAGASGAIFGIFGGLLGLLLVRRKHISTAVLKPMRKGVMAFLGYNLLFGLFIPGIDMAAHVGGLATGFVAGLALAVGSMARTANRRAMAQAAAVAVLSLGLGLAAYVAIGFARGRALANPALGGARPGPEFVCAGLERGLAEFDSVPERLGSPSMTAGTLRERLG